MCCLETLQSKHLNKIQRGPQKITSGGGVKVDFNFVIYPFMIFGKGLRRGAAGVTQNGHMYLTWYFLNSFLMYLEKTLLNKLNGVRVNQTKYIDLINYRAYFLMLILYSTNLFRENLTKNYSIYR